MTYEDAEASQAAVDWFNGKQFGSNSIKVSIAQRKAPEEGFGGRGRGRGGGGRGGGGGGGGGSRGRGDGGNLILLSYLFCEVFFSSLNYSSNFNSLGFSRGGDRGGRGGGGGGGGGRGKYWLIYFYWFFYLPKDYITIVLT